MSEEEQKNNKEQENNNIEQNKDKETQENKKEENEEKKEEINKKNIETKEEIKPEIKKEEKNENDKIEENNIEKKDNIKEKDELKDEKEKEIEIEKKDEKEYQYIESPEPFMQIISKELIELLKIPENRKCFDCETSPANWLCVNNAIFLCSKCAGEHRGYGSIISNLKFMMLDKLNGFQIAIMKRGGNKALDKLLIQYKIDKKKIDKLILYSSRLLEYHRDWLYNKLAGKNDPKPPNKYDYNKIMNNFKDNPRPPLEKVKIKDEIIINDENKKKKENENKKGNCQPQ